MRVLLLCSALVFTLPSNPPLAEEFEKWLGPQKMSKFFTIIELETKEERDELIPGLKCSLKVMRGKNIQFPVSKNPAFTVRDGKCEEIQKSDIADEQLFLAGLVDQQRELPGHNYYIIRAVVTEGKLKGATINFLNETSRRDTGAPTASVFEIPGGIELKEGEEFAFEIRQVYRK